MVRVLELMGRVSRLVRAEVEKLGHDGLRLSELTVVWTLMGQSPARPADIAARVGLPASTLTGILDRLEERGLIRREPSAADRRSVQIYLTDQCDQLLAEFRERLRQKIRHVLQGIPADKLRQLEEGLEAILQHLAAKSEATEG